MKCKCGNKLETNSKKCYEKCSSKDKTSCFIEGCFQKRYSILCNHHEMKWRKSKYYGSGVEAFFSYIREIVVGKK